MRNDFSLTKRNYFPHDVETIFIEIFLPKTKPMTVGIVSRPPSQTMNEHIYKLDTVNKETYILGDFITDVYLNDNMFLRNARLQFRILSHTMYGNTRIL